MGEPLTAEDRLRAVIGGGPVATVNTHDLQCVFTVLDVLRRSYAERGEVISVVRPTCDTCGHQRRYPGRPYACGLTPMTHMTDGVHVTTTIVPCSFLGSGCYAHTSRV